MGFREEDSATLWSSLVSWMGGSAGSSLSGVESAPAGGSASPSEGIESEPPTNIFISDAEGVDLKEIQGYIHKNRVGHNDFIQR